MTASTLHAYKKILKDLNVKNIESFTICWKKNISLAEKFFLVYWFSIYESQDSSWFGWLCTKILCCYVLMECLMECAYSQHRGIMIVL